MNTDNKKTGLFKNTKNVFFLLTLVILTALSITPVRAQPDEKLNEDDEHALYREGSFFDERYETVFIGVVQKMPTEGYAGIWVVDGSEVVVSDTTEIEGKPSVDSSVELEGRWTGNRFSAYSVHMKEPIDTGKNGEIYGMVERVPRTGPFGVWFVSGSKIKVTETTRFHEDKGKAEPGAEVEAKGKRIDGVFTAAILEVKKARVR